MDSSIPLVKSQRRSYLEQVSKDGSVWGCLHAGMTLQPPVITAPNP